MPFGRLVGDDFQDIELPSVVQPVRAADVNWTPDLRDLRKFEGLELNQRAVRDLRKAALRRQRAVSRPGIELQQQ